MHYRCTARFVYSGVSRLTSGAYYLVCYRLRRKCDASCISDRCLHHFPFTSLKTISPIPRSFSPSLFLLQSTIHPHHLSIIIISYITVSVRLPLAYQAVQSRRRGHLLPQTFSAPLRKTFSSHITPRATPELSFSFGIAFIVSLVIRQHPVDTL